MTDEQISEMKHAWNRIFGRGRLGELWAYCIVHKRKEIIDV